MCCVQFASGQRCCCYYAITVSFLYSTSLSLPKSWSILVYFHGPDHYNQAGFSDWASQCCQKMYNCLTFSVKPPRKRSWTEWRDVPLTAFLPSFNMRSYCRQGLTANNMTSSCSHPLFLCLFSSLHALLRHLFNICALCKHTLALPTSWKQQHSNSAINQAKAGNRGQEEEVEDRLWEKSRKKDGGGGCRVNGGQGQRNEAKMEGAEERKGEFGGGRGWEIEESCKRMKVEDKCTLVCRCHFVFVSNSNLWPSDWMRQDWMRE